MFEVFASALIGLMTVIISYIAFKLVSGSNRRVSLGSFLELEWLLEKTPAEASYLMFMLQSLIVITAAAFAFKVSNHIILTLDILYFISLLMLILFHKIKEAGSFSIQKI